MSELDSLKYIYGEDVKADADGTFTVSLSPWCEEPMCGFISEESALRAAGIVHKAMNDYASSAMREY